MIKGTNADCKLLKVTISETIATVTLLIFASKATNPAKAFRIYLKDLDTGKYTMANNNVYWIDQTNNYNYDSTNVDTKKYKEIMFNIDITRSNTSEISDKKWIRNCYIMLMDTSKEIGSSGISWSSDLLTLISNEFEIPTVKNIDIQAKNLTIFHLDQEDLTKTEYRGNIEVNFKLHFTSEKDFNYNNKNFSAFLNIRSVSTDEIIESKEISSSSTSLENTIISTKKYSLGAPVVIQILITNKNKDIMREYRKIFTPFKKYSNTYIKTKDGVKKVIAFYIVTDSKQEHEGDWL